MSTRIVFGNGLSLTVAQDRTEIINASHEDGVGDVTLESRSRRPLHINWDHVVAIHATPRATHRATRTAHPTKEVPACP